ncbi:hypothetical protein [Tenacibaculum aiptasiae]|uniref:hypothetical protein n=1 Tax=Tenacibaculum aiptasiae TaxID=426481 RepID=UPI00158829CA|nr:hypothetical protein [Tenacibaculum aiptasiae]
MIKTATKTFLIFNRISPPKTIPEVINDHSKSILLTTPPSTLYLLPIFWLQ